MNKTSGFTIVELLTVIAIIAVLSSIAIPNYIGWLPKQKLSSAARGVLSAFEYAKSRAVRDNADVLIVFDTANKTYTASIGGLNIKSGQLPAGIRFGTVDFDPGSEEQVQFNSQGFANKPGIVEVMNNTDTKKVIEVTVAGNIRIQ